MQDGSRKPRHKLYGGVAASVALHVIIAVALFVRLPAAEPFVPEEESVSVEIVPAPEEPQAEEEKPEEQAPEEQALDLTMPEPKPEEQQPEMPPPPEPAKQEAEEAGGEPPSPAASEAEQAAQEEAQEAPPEPQQPPSEPQQPEGQSAEQTPETAAEQPQAEDAAEPPPPQESVEGQPPRPAGGADTSEEQATTPGQPLPVLRPVFEFGDEDTGSGSSAGNAARQPQTEDTTGAENAEADNASENQPTGTGETATAEEAMSGDPQQPPLPTLSDDVSPPTVDAINPDSMPAGEGGSVDGLQTDFATEPPQPSATTAEAGETGDAPPRSDDPPPKEAERLFSRRDTEDAVARTAMGSVPRGSRAGQLCSTELTEQLRNSSPAFFPDIVPAFSLPEGTVLDVRRAAFRSGGLWYDIRFRCEVDQNAMRVVSFGLDIGDPVPRGEWRTRGFPEF